MPVAIEQLREAGQSVWLDFIRRGFLTSGGLERYVHDGWITGVTSNPTIFAKAVAGSTDYNQSLRRLAAVGEVRPYDAFVHLATEDVQLAADALRPLYDASAGADGFVSLEVPPGWEHDAEGTIGEATRLWQLIDRPNAMIKVPGTPEAVAACEELVAAGVNVNVTLLFDSDVYEGFARAYIAGLERRLQRGDDVAGVAGVASFFVSRVDVAAEALLPERSALRGAVAIANAHEAYGRFQSIFSGPRWEALALAGARVQRPLWASTSAKNKAYPELMYVEGLALGQTVNTLPEMTLAALAKHGPIDGRAARRAGQGAKEVLAATAAAGVDLKQLTAGLLADGLEAFRADFEKLLGCLADSIAAMPRGRPQHSGRLGDLAPRLEARLDALERNQVVRRLWEGDHTLWKLEPGEIPDRLGWLAVVEEMPDEIAALGRLAEEVAADGYETAVLLGMGGSSLAAEVLHSTYGTVPGALRLEVLDTTLPAAIAALERRIDPARTLFVVASKSGTTIETLSHLAYFWEKMPDGRHFIAITDPGTPLEAEARERGFRHVFLNRADIGGRYSAVSYFGMVPAALIGVDLEELLDRTHEMLHACHPCVPLKDNPGAWLGAVLGTAGRSGRDKLTLVLPEPIQAFGVWIEQLIAESTGKEGTGILPVEGEPLGPAEVYGDDRLFVVVGEHEGLEGLVAAGHPIVELPYSDRAQVGAGFFRWEFATPIAGYLLGIDPFDQPNVQEAKEATARILREGAELPATPSLETVLGQVRPGDYISIQAYLPREAGRDPGLQGPRLALRDRFRVATTVGYGPRFLHSTGQYHKGGRNNGIFIQVVDEEEGNDLVIPGKPYTFGELSRAQALGDLQSLRARQRRVTRVSLAELREVAG